MCKKIQNLQTVDLLSCNMKILAIIYNSSYREKSSQRKHLKLQQQQCSICCLLQLITFINLIAIAVNATTATKLAMKTNANMIKTSIINDSYIDVAPQQQSTNEVAFDKDVVDLLVKRYAPIVWLAPEEKFMPLGVDEFLNHVHPIDKDGLPATDKSEKVFLATNSNIDELLQNDKSFIYGQNPNERAVPIYAMVTLCNQNMEKPLLNNNNNDYNNYDNNNLDAGNDVSTPIPNNNNSKINNNNYYYNNNNHATLGDLTRGQYIPIKMDTYEQLNKTTVLRPSRLYPSFVKRLKRELLQETINYQYVAITPQHANDYVNLSAHELVTGETDTTASGTGFNADIMSSTLHEYAENASVQEVNNFIANLADNVKFSPSLNDATATLDATNYSADFDYGATNNKFYYINNFDKQKSTAFHVTYWMFYPYSQGKSICTLSLGPLGHIPFPALYGFCLGRRKEIGSHIGDWEHMSLYFNGDNSPEAMYVSAHDAGAYYTFNRLTGTFEFQKQETRKGLLQRPNFPKTVTTYNSHPVLFAAKGSHGLWTAPGKHRFVKVARLYDINGFGTAWNTWKQVEIAYENLYARSSLLPAWLSFKGKWGNPRSKCHPFRRIGLNFCEFTDGPTGIPLKEPHFQCAPNAANNFKI